MQIKHTRIADPDIPFKLSHIRLFTGVQVRIIKVIVKIKSIKLSHSPELLSFLKSKVNFNAF